MAPEVETFTDQGQNFLFLACDGFDILVDFTQYLRATTFFDNAGVPIRAQLFFQFRGVWFNSETGTSVSDDDDWTTIVDFAAGTAANLGLVYRLVIPGAGTSTPFFIEAGKVTFDLVTGAPLFASATAFNFPEDPAAFFCPAFA